VIGVDDIVAWRMSALDSQRRQIADAMFNAIASVDERLKHDEVVSTNAPSGPESGTVQLSRSIHPPRAAKFARPSLHRTYCFPAWTARCCDQDDVGVDDGQRRTAEI
jgi:hypothetical protein